MAELTWKRKLKALHGVEPETAWEIIQQIRIENGGVAPASAIVEAARPETSPLHKAFEWDDGKAAAEFRKAQARSIVRNFELVFESGNTAPALVSVKMVRDGVTRKGYANAEEAMLDGDLRKQVLKAALSALLSLQTRYRTLAEMAGVWEAARAVAEEHQIAL